MNTEFDCWTLDRHVEEFRNAPETDKVFIEVLKGTDTPCCTQHLFKGLSSEQCKTIENILKDAAEEIEEILTRTSFIDVSASVLKV